MWGVNAMNMVFLKDFTTKIKGYLFNVSNLNLIKIKTIHQANDFILVVFPLNEIKMLESKFIIEN